ncbi:hypothetical protein LOK49_LG11G01768 [Camellia lanceoleosa]|uniref:Uncharacterized protein n=1 Tax=Camellia lanceoleosa TaxID=1840588 RepID=A0ACC0G0T6_9ERIC|nr:hypothetical protein LOK49_LG11G01768 [Camellia lanceoleosa]
MLMHHQRHRGYDLGKVREVSGVPMDQESECVAEWFLRVSHAHSYFPKTLSLIIIVQALQSIHNLSLHRWICVTWIRWSSTKKLRRLVKEPMVWSIRLGTE